MWAWSRALRIADGPDEVHRRTIVRRELRRADVPPAKLWTTHSPLCCKSARHWLTHRHSLRGWCWRRCYACSFILPWQTVESLWHIEKGALYSCLTNRFNGQCIPLSNALSNKLVTVCYSCGFLTLQKLFSKFYESDRLNKLLHIYFVALIISKLVTFPPWPWRRCILSVNVCW